jgi:nucleoside-diphosphate-sugar epimerase
MTVLVTGATGLIGSNMRKAGFDNSLTPTTLGYSPVSSRDACAETVEWLRANGEIE